MAIRFGVKALYYIPSTYAFTSEPGAKAYVLFILRFLHWAVNIHLVHFFREEAHYAADRFGQAQI
jgi:hypothetical protein